MSSTQRMDFLGRIAAHGLCQGGGSGRLAVGASLGACGLAGAAASGVQVTARGGLQGARGGTTPPPWSGSGERISQRPDLLSASGEAVPSAGEPIAGRAEKRGMREALRVHPDRAGSSTASEAPEVVLLRKRIGPLHAGTCARGGGDCRAVGLLSTQVVVVQAKDFTKASGPPGPCAPGVLLTLFNITKRSSAVNDEGKAKIERFATASPPILHKAPSMLVIV